MISIGFVTALAILALITQAGVIILQRLYPAQGSMIEVAGGRLHVLDIGPRDAAGPPVVMIHGASSNLEAMRQPLGDRLAGHRRVILIDRPGHGWSSRAHLEDSTPAIQGRMIDEALEKLGVALAENEGRGLDFTPPRGESPRMVQARLSPLLAEIAATGLPTVAITPTRPLWVVRTARRTAGRITSTTGTS